MMVGCASAWLWLTTRESTLVGNHAWGHECVPACSFSLSLSFTQKSCFLLFLDFIVGAKQATLLHSIWMVFDQFHDYLFSQERPINQMIKYKVLKQSTILISINHMKCMKNIHRPCS